MKETKLADLVLDFDLYPRAEVDSHHVSTLVDALEAGADLPPIVADKKSKRLVDGFHRHRAYKRVLGDDGEVEVVFKSYADDAAIFLDAMRYNAGHGRSLATFDRAHCVLRAEALGIAAEAVASALSITVDNVGRLKAERVGALTVVGGSRSIPLKRTIRHMAGQSLTQAQSDANSKLSGMEQAFYVNQVIILVENDLIDTSNGRVMAALDKLLDCLSRRVRKAA